MLVFYMSIVKVALDPPPHVKQANVAVIVVIEVIVVIGVIANIKIN